MTASLHYQDSSLIQYLIKCRSQTFAKILLNYLLKFQFAIYFSFSEILDLVDCVSLSFLLQAFSLLSSIYYHVHSECFESKGAKSFRGALSIRRRDGVFCAVAGRSVGRASGRVCNQLGVRRINRSSEGLRRWRRRDVLCPAELASHLSDSAAQTTRRKYQFINVCRRRVAADASLAQSARGFDRH